ncbi:MAG: ABC-2 family transporter protein [Polyangiales bacterium]
MTHDSLAGQFRFAGALITTSFRAALALRGSFWLQLGFMFLNNLCFFVFWWVLFARVGQVRGWSVHEVELLVGVSAASFGLAQVVAGGARHISRWVDEGELDPLLVQPKPTWLYAVGSRSNPSGMGDILSGALLMHWSGHVTASAVPLALLCVVCGALVFLGCALAFYSLAFWLAHTESLSRQVLDFTVLFSTYPETLFSGFLRFVLFTALPAGFVGYLPVRVLIGAQLTDLALLASGAAAFLGLGIWVFGRGLRRYASGSRFGVWG